jgi:radical SAM superfamily enzyme YgiQ (UPF0313 family)
VKRLDRLLLIRPNLGDFRSKDAMEPLTAALLKALTPPEVAFEFVDERLETVDPEAEADLIAFTVETFTARRAYELADTFRRRGIPVVMGGYHPSFCPYEALEHADAVVIGDAETTWPRLLADFFAGRLQRLYRDPGTGPVLSIRPDRSAYAGKRYAPLSLVQHGRGCRFVCDFCSIRAFYGDSQAAYPVEVTLAEFFSAQHRRVLFVDDNLFASRPRLVALLEALADHNRRLPLLHRKQWCCQISLDVCRDETLLDLLAKSGCFMVIVGFESLQRGNLQEMAKGWNRGRHVYEQAIHRLHERGILVYGTFVFGYGADGCASFAETADFARAQRLCIANFNPLTPTPGSPLYERLRQQGRLLHERWWLDPGYRYGRATFRPRGMTPEELERGCFEARLRFYNVRSMAVRLLPRPFGPVLWKNLDVAVLANWVSRTEILNKQGRRLGEAGDMHEAYADQA